MVIHQRFCLESKVYQKNIPQQSTFYNNYDGLPKNLGICMVVFPPYQYTVPQVNFTFHFNSATTFTRLKVNEGRTGGWRNKDVWCEQ